ncbi:hypothetical protein PM082_005179 [Marasmius tenuissimus]|nr:hypothetical protein PM082_005179 [Marasmius tenuissimus]
MYALRRIKAVLLGEDVSPESIARKLEDGGVPITDLDVDCRSCPDPCDEGHEPYPAKFNVDTESQMLGMLKPYHKQIVVSTGKIDWELEVTLTRGSLAALVEWGVDRHRPFSLPSEPEPESEPGSGSSSSSSSTSATTHDTESPSPAHIKIESAPPPPPVPGIFDSSDTSVTRLNVLNGSHHTLSDDKELETVLVFPDYLVVCEIPRTREGAQRLWDGWLDPHLGRGLRLDRDDDEGVEEEDEMNMRSCSIAAGKLLAAFTNSLERKGHQVDTELEHPHDESLEECSGNQHEEVERYLRESAQSKRVLILRTSHVGGHKFAGLCTIYTPQRSGIWYGRVTTHEVDGIVENTIEKGLVVPKLLRGGINLRRLVGAEPEEEGARRKCRTLHDW